MICECTVLLQWVCRLNCSLQIELYKFIVAKPCFSKVFWFAKDWWVSFSQFSNSLFIPQRAVQLQLEHPYAVSECHFKQLGSESYSVVSSLLFEGNGTNYECWARYNQCFYTKQCCNIYPCEHPVVKVHLPSICAPLPVFQQCLLHATSVGEDHLPFQGPFFNTSYSGCR